jgi:ketosteroid isomerase-like protein
MTMGFSASRALAPVLVVLALSACDAPRSSQKTQEEIKAFFADFEATLNKDEFANDPAIALRFFDEDKIRLFDIMGPEQIDAKIFREHFIATSKAAPAKFTFSDMQIHTDGGAVAFVSYIERVAGRMGAAPLDMRIRVLDGLEKRDGRWRIVNESFSLHLSEAALAAAMAPEESIPPDDAPPAQ